MHQLVTEALQNIIKIHQEKEVHSLEDLDRLLAVHLNVQQQALQKRLLVPFETAAAKGVHYIAAIYEQLSEIRKKFELLRATNKDKCLVMHGNFKINFGIGEFKFQFPENDTEKWSSLVIDYVVRENLLLNSFTRMHDSIANHIELDVLPFELTGEKFYLRQGKLIMPTTIKTPGFHVFEIEAEGKDISFMPLTEYGIPSLEKTIQDHVKPKTLGTIALAKNTENYSLHETALPIVKEKYLRRLFEQK